MYSLENGNFKSHCVTALTYYELLKIILKMKKRVFAFLITAFILASLGLAIALAAEDFILTKEADSLSTCPGATILLKTVVENSGDATDFTIQQDGTAAKFTITVPTGFSLASGQKKEIFSYVTPSSTTQPGSYSLRVIATSRAISKSVSFDIAVENCRAAELSIEQIKEVCPADVAAYKATLNNAGKFTEDYTLAVVGTTKSFATLSDNQLRLNPGEQKDFFIYVTPPADKSGDFELTVTASSADGKAFASARASLRVLPCYNFDLIAEKNFFALCEASQLIVPLTLENKGTVLNSYSLSLQAPRWTALDSTLKQLSQGQKTNVNLIFAPPFSTEGNFTVLVNVESERGKVKKILPLNIRVDKCYNLFVDAAKEETTLCNLQSEQVPVSVRNTGRFSANYVAAVSGATFASLDKQTFQLQPGEDTSLILQLTPPEGNRAGVYNVKVSVTDPVSKLSVSDAVKVTTVTREECFKPSLTTSQSSVEVAKDSAAAVTLNVENIGKQEASYIIELSGNAIAFTQVNPSVLNLAAGQTDSVFLHIAPPLNIEEGNYNVEAIARVKDTGIKSSVIVNIKVLPKLKEVQPTLPEVTPVSGEVIGGVEEVEEVEGVEEAKGTSKSLFESLRQFLQRIFRIGNVTNLTEQPTGEVIEITEELPEEVIEETEVNVTKRSFLDIIRAWFKRPAENVTTAEEIEEIEEQIPTTPPIVPTVPQQPQQPGTPTTPITPITPTEQPTGEEVIEEVEVLPTEAKPLSALLTGASIKQFFSTYRYHIISAVILVIILIIIFTGYWKKIVDFFVEEETEKAERKRKS